MASPSPALTDVPSTEPSEPSILTGLLTSFGTVVINGLVVFGVPMTADARIWSMGIVAFLSPFLASLIIRFKVFSPRTVDQLMSAWKMAISDAQYEATIAKAQSAAAATAQVAVAEILPKVIQAVQGASVAPQQPSPAPRTSPPPQDVMQPPAEPQQPASSYLSYDPNLPGSGDPSAQADSPRRGYVPNPEIDNTVRTGGYFDDYREPERGYPQQGPRHGLRR